MSRKRFLDHEQRRKANDPDRNILINLQTNFRSQAGRFSINQRFPVLPDSFNKILHDIFVARGIANAGTGGPAVNILFRGIGRVFHPVDLPAGDLVVFEHNRSSIRMNLHTTRKTGLCWALGSEIIVPIIVIPMLRDRRAVIFHFNVMGLDVP
ncbi:MAG: hypothetical protein U5K69_08220 [Balneolaceae bacterium]|nr:hypothetical protein [Balneolaceae bacterium]